MNPSFQTPATAPLARLPPFWKTRPNSGNCAVWFRHSSSATLHRPSISFVSNVFVVTPSSHQCRGERTLLDRVVACCRLGNREWPCADAVPFRSPPRNEPRPVIPDEFVNSLPRLHRRAFLGLMLCTSSVADIVRGPSEIICGLLGEE